MKLYCIVCVPFSSAACLNFFFYIIWQRYVPEFRVLIYVRHIHAPNISLARHLSMYIVGLSGVVGLTRICNITSPPVSLCVPIGVLVLVAPCFFCCVVCGFFSLLTCLWVSTTRIVLLWDVLFSKVAVLAALLNNYKQRRKKLVHSYLH
jgi:hypothetical protein